MNIENEYRNRLKQELDVLTVTAKELSDLKITKENFSSVLSDCYNIISLVDYMKLIINGIEIESGEEFSEDFSIKRLVSLEQKLSDAIAFNQDIEAVSALKSMIELILSDEMSDALLECIGPSKAVA